MTRLEPPLTIAMTSRQSSNPYPATLSSHLEQEGYKVIDFEWELQTLRAADVVHFHWPDEFFTGSSADGGRFVRLKVWIKIAILTAFRCFGGTLIWTVHNVWPHDQPHRRSLTLHAFLRNVDGAILLSEASKAIACLELPGIAKRSLAVIPKCHYKETMVTKTAPLRSRVTGPIRIGNFGRVRPYKNVQWLIRKVAELPEGSVLLTVAGDCEDPAQRSEIEALSRGRENIRLRLQILSEEELERIVDDCDAIVLPYRDILNSGAALFALSRGRPVMVPAIGSLPELKRNVGEEWVFTYSGEFTAEKLKEFLSWVAATDRPSEPDLSSYDCATSARRIAGFYRSLIAGAGHERAADQPVAGSVA